MMPFVESIAWPVTLVEVTTLGYFDCVTKAEFINIHPTMA